MSKWNKPLKLWKSIKVVLNGYTIDVESKIISTQSLGDESPGAMICGKDLPDWFQNKDTHELSYSIGHSKNDVPPESSLRCSYGNW